MTALDLNILAYIHESGSGIADQNKVISAHLQQAKLNHLCLVM